MAIIESTLTLIRDSLNSFLRNLYPYSDAEDWVSLSNVISPDGQAYEKAKRKIVMFLSNIEHETSISTYQRTVPAGSEFVAIAPPLYIDLFLLFYANFPDDNYREGLKMISSTISYFQQNPWFTRDTMPDLDPAIDKITMEFTNLDADGLSHLMNLAGVKYLPSVYYKLRMIPFTSNMVLQEVPPVKAIRATGAPKEDRTETRNLKKKEEHKKEDTDQG